VTVPYNDGMGGSQHTSPRLAATNEEEEARDERAYVLGPLWLEGRKKLRFGLRCLPASGHNRRPYSFCRQQPRRVLHQAMCPWHRIGRPDATSSRTSGAHGGGRTMIWSFLAQLPLRRTYGLCPDSRDRII
jgi:hypothetical protein